MHPNKSIVHFYSRFLIKIQREIIGLANRTIQLLHKNPHNELLFSSLPENFIFLDDIRMMENTTRCSVLTLTKTVLLFIDAKFKYSRFGKSGFIAF